MSEHYVDSTSAGVRIDTESDVMDALSAAAGVGGLLLREADLGKDFFELKSGLAGAAFQKFVNYNVRLALVVQSPEAYGPRMVELAREYSRGQGIRIVATEDEAAAWLSDQGA